MKCLRHINLLILFILLFTVQISAQSEFERLAKRYSCSSKNENAVLQYFANYEKQQKEIAALLKKQREYQIAKFGKLLSQISGHCEFGNGSCPVSLVKPYYSPEAKQQRIFGKQKVTVVVDDKGKIIFARVRNGKPFLAQAARQAACRSKFTPMLFDNKPVKYKATIIYNFILN